jgi:hypothetical protein
MAFVADAAIDAALDYLASNADKITLCSQEPTTYTQAGTTYKLADAAVSSGEFTKANGDVSGRKITLAEQTGDTVDTTGTATHWALIDDTDSELLATGALTASQSLTATNPFTINAMEVWAIKYPL